ncbi:MAG: YlxM family DNA-binding protein [Clostridia bacterium]|nr:YlxM family DNA-binding protein [Clostridia bacterium]MBQ3553801.1 YlxM family DNA-binding protein [Clostridia bacterium]
MSVTMLYDFYGDMLTDKQKEAIELYYNEDLSLAEIAEPLGISRQGVRDNIKRGEKQLMELEEKLGLVKRFMQIGEKLDDALNLLSGMRQYETMYVHSHKLAVAMKELSEKIEKVRQEI